ncbi:5996_t:CDS:1, partial [Paraglomus brasilianum]
KDKLGEVHEVKDVKIVALEHNQEENTLTTHEKIHYKRGYMDINSAIQQKNNKEVSQLVKKIESILKSDLSPYERKIALFNVIKRLEVGTMSPEKKKRTN